MSLRNEAGGLTASGRRELASLLPVGARTVSVEKPPQPSTLRGNKRPGRGGVGVARLVAAGQARPLPSSSDGRT